MKQKTTDERLKRYALNQQPMDNLDRHMPPSKNLFWIALASPLVALTAWIWLIWLAMKES